MLDLEKFRVQNAPSKIWYIPNFIDSTEEQVYLSSVNDAPKPKWEVLSNRRLMTFGGEVAKNVLLPIDDIPEELGLLMKKVDQLGIIPKATNHILVNEYLAGQGIMPHTDGPAYYPLVATVSLGSSILLDLYRKIDEKKVESPSERFVGSMLLERGSLFLMTDEAYSGHLHGIREVKEDVINETVLNPGKYLGQTLPRETRVSITIRNIPRVSKLDIKTLLFKK
ncbi:unnamed protein product [Auanema sp. JU1783]|nr:unnamed protein product [Auanema sp. JU1783]